MLNTSILAFATLGASLGLTAATIGPAVAGTRDPCRVLPAATVQAILGSPVQAHAPAPSTYAGQTVTACLYLGPHQASLQLTDAGSSAAAAAYVASRKAATHSTRLTNLPGSLVDRKGSYVLIVAAAQPSDYSKLGALRSAALKNL